MELYALSESLPLVSRDLNEVFNQASPFFKAQYILGRVVTDLIDASEAYTKALRYPICNQLVFQAIHTKLKDQPYKHHIHLPRRLFRSLKCPPSGWSSNDHPIPFLQYLYQTPDLPSVNTNSNEGYALTRAVHAKFRPLVDLLLDHGASPKYRDGLCVKVAIRQQNLEMVRTLVEKHDAVGKKGKRRRLQDRLALDPTMLKIAVMSNAHDVVEYLYKEKKILPDMQTLKKMTFWTSLRAGPFLCGHTLFCIKPEQNYWETVFHSP